MAELLPCSICGRNNVSVYEEKMFFFPVCTIIRCSKCGRTIERRTIKQAVHDWNTRTPKERGGEK